VTGKRLTASIGGVMAILLWSGSISLQRLLSQQLGPMITGATGCLIAGLLGSVILLLRPSTRKSLLAASGRETFVCGALFVMYSICFVSAVALATSTRHVFVVGVINYLWPAMTLVLSIPILKSRPRPLLPVGVIVGVAGAVMAAVFQRELSLADFLDGLRGNLWPYLLSLVNAVTWAFYSNLTRRWVDKVPGGVVFVYLLVAGVLMAALAAALGDLGRGLPVLLGDSPQWAQSVLLPMALQSIGPALGAYILWETAMRLGSVTFVSVTAYLTPVFSLIVSCIVLHESAGWGLWGGTALVVLGAFICKFSIRDRVEGGKE
jgi:drug/metabolite transporter (DMT)-like permease